MDKMLPLDANSETKAQQPTDFKAAVTQIFAEMDEINARIERNQAETAELRAETRVMLDQLMTA